MNLMFDFKHMYVNPFVPGGQFQTISIGPFLTEEVSGYFYHHHILWTFLYLMHSVNPDPMPLSTASDLGTLFANGHSLDAGIIGYCPSTRFSAISGK